MDPLSGGTCQGIRNCHFAFTKIGIDQEVVCVDNPAAQYLRNEPFPIHAVGPAKGKWQYSKRLLPWLCKNMSRFDVVIVNGLWLYHGYAVQKAFKHIRKRNSIEPPKLRPKVFVMPHGMLDPYFQKAADRKLKAIRNQIYWKFIEARLINNSDGLLFTTETELLLARKPFKPYSPKKEANVGYGVIEPPTYQSAMKEAFEKKCKVGENPYLLFLGRIHEKKGVDLLISAYLHLKEERSKASQNLPNLVIAGPGLETVYGKKIQKLVKDNESLASSVLFAGMVEGDEKWGAFYGCDASVLPSHQENFGISVVEALACSKPVLISKEVNICKEIETTGGGIVAGDTLEGTIGLLKTWLNLSAAEKVEMQNNAKATFEGHFNIDAVSLSFRNALVN
jgi:glycosyltransferase involved in cell wall biosynthesis